MTEPGIEWKGDRMSRNDEQFLRGALARVFSVFVALAFALVVAGAQQTQSQKAPSKQASTQPAGAARGKAFASPDEAAAALHTAAQSNDEVALLGIFSPGAREMLAWSADSKVRQEEHATFARKYDQMHRLVNEPDGTVALYVGAENWPLPIPLVKIGGSWYFDAGLGKKEVMYRRVGRNELEALEVCHALIEAEKDYYASTHAYAVKFISSAGSHDGLYWAAATPNAKSPIGPFLAHAGLDASSDANRAPFHGYYYRILVAQGASAPGGARSYDNGGKMDRGFAILAFPAEYRSSGVVTFIMDQNGAADEKDLGPMTETRAKQISSYDPDATWKKVVE